MSPWFRCPLASLLSIGFAAAGGLLAQQADGLTALERGVQRCEQAVAQAPVSDDRRDGLVAELAEAFAGIPLDRHDLPLLGLLLRLTRVSVPLALVGELATWVEPRDRALAGLAEAGRRQALASILANAWTNVGRDADARARLERALDDLGERPLTDSFALVLRRGLGYVTYRQRDYAAALAVQQRVVASQRAIARDAELLEDLRQLGRVQHWSGDRDGAYASFEECLQLASELWGDRHLQVAIALHDFGSASAALGDYRAAYEVGRKSLAIREELLPPGAFEIQSTKQGLSQVLVQLGELDAARRLQEEVLEALVPSEPRSRRLWLLGKHYLARILYSLEDFDGARANILEMIEAAGDGAGESDRDLGTARTLLGCLERRRGDLEASRRLLEQSFAGLSMTLPLDHSFTQIACAELLTTSRLQGDVGRAVELTTLLLDAAEQSLRGASLASRPTARLAAIQGMGLSGALSLSLGEVADDVPTRQGLIARALLVSQLVNGVAGRIARVASQARQSASAEHRRLDRELEQASAELRRAPSPAAEQRLADLVRERERLDRHGVAQRATERERAVALPELGELTAALPEGAAAVAYVEFTRRRLDPAMQHALAAHSAIAAIVLRADGGLGLVDLGDREQLTLLVEQMGPASYKRLRRVVLDPVLALVGEADEVFVALHDCLCLVPWDALPMRDGSPVGEHVRLRRVSTLLDLLGEPVALPTDGGRLLAVGDVDYDLAVAGAASEPGESVAPPLSLLRGDGRFGRLAGSRREIDAAADSFRARFPAGQVTMLTGADADRAGLQRAVVGASLVHFATHGFVAYDRIARASDTPGGGELEGIDFDLTPFRLCGLALAGANADSSAVGRITAEELQGLELGDCYLAVLSACESALGAWSEGQGFASMHEALHIAGVRFVVSTLWPVGDAAAQHLMGEFYRQLFADPARPHRALWRAKMAMRDAGMSFIDWAAFQLSGV